MVNVAGHRIVVILFLCSTAGAQTVVYGADTLLYGDLSINPTTDPYTRIFVLNPPQIDVSPNSINTNFKATVMRQSAIDGVVFQVIWNFIETAVPSTTDCTANAPDVCQPDPIATGWFHTYNWNNFDGVSGTPCTDTTSKVPSQWFCDFSAAQDGSGYKQVALQLIGVSQDPNVNTPAYITDSTSSWYAAVTAVTLDTQDVVNAINASGCGAAYNGSTSVTTSEKFVGDGVNSYVTVTWPNPPFVVHDSVWVQGVDGGGKTGFDVTGRSGALIHRSPLAPLVGLSIQYRPPPQTARYLEAPLR